MNDLHNRRTFLRAAAVAGAAWVTADLGQVEEALAWAGHQTGKADAALTVLTRAQADVLDALTSRILPSVDGRPGAHEAGAVYFIDRALATFNANQKKVYVDGIADLNRRAGLKSKASADLRSADRRRSRTKCFTTSRRRPSSRPPASTPSSAPSRCRRGAATATTRAGTCSASSTSRVPAAVRLLRRRRSTGEAEHGPAGAGSSRSVTRRFQPSDTVDFAIVGSGAAGGIIAKELVDRRLLGRRARAGAAADGGAVRLTTSSARSCRTSNVNDPATQPQTFRATPQRPAPARRWR